MGKTFASERFAKSNDSPQSGAGASASLPGWPELSHNQKLNLATPAPSYFMIKYEIKLSADLGNVFPPIGDVLKDINSSLAKWGCDEQLMLRGEPFSATLTIEREATEHELEQMKRIIEDTFNDGQPAWKVRVESIRRKSGNVQQQVA